MIDTRTRWLRRHHFDVRRKIRLALRVPLGHPSWMHYDWDSKKNNFLKATRNVCFEAVIVHLGRGDLWRVAGHPNQVKYPGQKLFFVAIDDYIYIVPFEERDEVIWLVTIIPSRKATKRYLEDQ